MRRLLSAQQDSVKPAKPSSYRDMESVARQNERERRAAVGGARSQLGASAVRFSDGAHDGEPETSSTLRVSRGRKALEQTCGDTRVDTRSAIAHEQHKLAISALDTRFHHGPRGREAACVE
jgi:hypothetical protein